MIQDVTPYLLRGEMFDQTLLYHLATGGRSQDHFCISTESVTIRKTFNLTLASRFVMTYSVAMEPLAALP